MRGTSYETELIVVGCALLSVPCRQRDHDSTNSEFLQERKGLDGFSCFVTEMSRKKKTDNEFNNNK